MTATGKGQFFTQKQSKNSKFKLALSGLGEGIFVKGRRLEHILFNRLLV